MSSSRGGESRKRGDDDRQKLIVSAATTCFGNWGVARTRMDDIAKEAGIARTILYRYFASKEELLEAVIIQHIDQRARALHNSLRLEGPATSLIMEALRVGITESSSDRVSESVLGVEVVHGTAHLVATSVRVAEAMNCYWAPFLEYAKRRGELRPNVQLEDAVRWLTTIVFYFLTLPEMRPKPDELEAYLRTFVVESIVSLPND